MFPKTALGHCPVCGWPPEQALRNKLHQKLAGKSPWFHVGVIFRRIDGVEITACMNCAAKFTAIINQALGPELGHIYLTSVTLAGRELFHADNARREEEEVSTDG